MSTDNTSPTDATNSPMRVSGRLFVIILILVIIIALAWLIYARMNFRGSIPPQPTRASQPQ
jgi:hypothetical protein